jgi:hypothetical protein
VYYLMCSGKHILPRDPTPSGGGPGCLTGASLSQGICLKYTASDKKRGA